MTFGRSSLAVLCLAATAAAAAATLPACGESTEAVDVRTDHETAIDRIDWLEKASKVLRGGDGLGPRDDVDALAAMSKDAVVDRWMEDPRFGESVLAFNLYYLGRSVDRVRLPGSNPVARQ